MTVYTVVCAFGSIGGARVPLDATLAQVKFFWVLLAVKEGLETHLEPLAPNNK
jgi:hypothetical protein